MEAKPRFQLLFKFLHYTSLIIAVQTTLATVCGLIIGNYYSVFTHMQSPYVGALWCATSAILVIQATTHESITLASTRVIGSFIGAFVAVIWILILGYSVLTLAISIFFAIVICSLVGLKTSFRIAALTIVVMIIVGALNSDVNPWLNGLARFIESTLGIIIALIFTLPLKMLRVTIHDRAIGHLD